MNTLRYLYKKYVFFFLFSIYIYSSSDTQNNCPEWKAIAAYTHTNKQSIFHERTIENQRTKYTEKQTKE